jgi:hypothetical protein
MIKYNEEIMAVDSTKLKFLDSSKQNFEEKKTIFFFFIFCLMWNHFLESKNYVYLEKIKTWLPVKQKTYKNVPPGRIFTILNDVNRLIIQLHRWTISRLQKTSAHSSLQRLMMPL